MATTDPYKTKYMDNIHEKCHTGKLWHLEISPIDACNMQCSFCPKKDELVAPNTYLEMPVDLCKKIAQELKDYNFNGTVSFCGYGEPLLAKRIVDMVEIFSFVSVTLMTNGTVLTHDLMRDLVNAGVDKVLISRYGEEGYEDFGRYECVEIRERRILPVVTNRGGTLGTDCKQQACYYPFYFMIIDWNGDVFPCCQDWNRHNKMGNLNFQTVEQIWNSPQFKRIRYMLKNEGRIEPPCNVCDVDGTVKGGRNFEAYE